MFYEAIVKDIPDNTEFPVRIVDTWLSGNIPAAPDDQLGNHYLTLLALTRFNTPQDRTGPRVKYLTLELNGKLVFTYTPLPDGQRLANRARLAIVLDRTPPVEVGSQRVTYQDVFGSVNKNGDTFCRGLPEGIRPDKQDRFVLLRDVEYNFVPPPSPVTEQYLVVQTFASVNETINLEGITGEYQNYLGNGNVYDQYGNSIHAFVLCEQFVEQTIRLEVNSRLRFV
nr:MAG: capsid protein [Owegonang virus 15]